MLSVFGGDAVFDSESYQSESVAADGLTMSMTVGQNTHRESYLRVLFNQSLHTLIKHTAV